MIKRSTRFAALILTTASVFMATPISAQDTNVDGRVKKLEKEMRAVQRKVFPGGAGRFFEPEIKTSEQKVKANQPTTTAVTDLISRVDALETQLASVTGQVEEQGNLIRKMQAQLKALETKAASNTTVAASPAPAMASNVAASDAPAVSNEPTTRAGKVAAIEYPETSDAGEDSYIYGYRLWAAKFYPEAQAQLQKTVDSYASHKRASHARNLLGRAWLDNGKSSTAAKIFYGNYDKFPEGARAPDSLYFLGVALTNLRKTKEACEAFTELEKMYPDVAADRLASRLSSGRSSAKCS